MSHVYECICVIDNLLSVVTQLGQFLSVYIAICNPCCLIYIQFVYVQYSFNLLLPPFEVYRYDNEKYTHIYHRWCLCQKNNLQKSVFDNWKLNAIKTIWFVSNGHKNGHWIFNVIGGDDHADAPKKIMAKNYAHKIWKLKLNSKKTAVDSVNLTY